MVHGLYQLLDFVCCRLKLPKCRELVDPESPRANETGQRAESWTARRARPGEGWWRLELVVGEGVRGGCVVGRGTAGPGVAYMTLSQKT